MASPSEQDIFEQLKVKPDPEALARRDAEVNLRIHEQYEKAQARLGELLDHNSTLPATVGSVTVLNAPNTRRGFLQRIFDPLLRDDDERPQTLGDILRSLSLCTSKLGRFDIYHEPISLFFDRPDSTDPSSAANDISVFLSVREKSRVVLSSGTWAGSNDGSVYFNLLLRNLFGGAESFTANASYGTRTRSSYSAAFETPILSNPDLRWEIAGLQSSTDKSWASHEERLRGGNTKFKWLTPNGHRHELGYTGMWRQVTSLAESASPTVRGDAGDSFKSSITHTWINDQRDYPLLPNRGYLMKTIAEVAGFGPLKGDVAFGKLEFDTQSALPIPVPGYGTETGISLTTSLRGGVLYPLTLGTGNSPGQSRINDRFFLGGPTDIRGFRFGGLGPHDGSDAVGGDIYYAGSASLLLPFPRVGKDHPLRMQAFINGGRLLALKESSDVKRSQQSSDNVGESVRSTIAELGNELPSIAAGVGVIYALPMARFELNFSLPLVQRKGEEARKGLSLGLGMSFL